MADSLLATPSPATPTETAAAETTPAPAAPAPAAAASAETAPAPLRLGEGDGAIDLPADFAGADGAPDVMKLAAAWRDLDAARAQAAPPETYSLDGLAPEVLGAITGGVEPGDDPALQDFLSRAREAGLSQAQVEAVLDFAGALSAPPDPAVVAAAEAERQAGELAALRGAFGAGTDQVLADTRAWVDGLGRAHGPEMAEAAHALAATAAGVRFLHGLASGRIRGGGGAVPAVRGSGQEAPALDEAGLKALMTDARYWRDRDPALVRQVEEGFRRLYPDKPN